MSVNRTIGPLVLMIMTDETIKNNHSEIGRAEFTIDTHQRDIN